MVVKNKILTLTVFVLLVSCCNSIYSQDKSGLNKWLVQVNIQHQDAIFNKGIKLGQLRVARKVLVRPLYSIDMQYFFLNTSIHKGLISCNAGFFDNTYHNRWLSLKLGMGYEGQFSKSIFTSMRVEVGGVRVKSSSIQYKFENEQWIEVKNRTPSVFNFLLNYRFDVGYRINKNKNPIELVLISHIMLHSNTVLNAVFPYYGIGIGCRFAL